MTGPPRPRTHYVGDGCEPAHFLTVLAPEDPETVRERDEADWTRGQRDLRAASGEATAESGGKAKHVLRKKARKD